MPRKRNPKERPEHDSNTEPSKRAKHEHGQRRKAMGQGKDKKRTETGLVSEAIGMTEIEKLVEQKRWSKARLQLRKN